MGVVVENMEMPNCCLSCPFVKEILGDYYCLIGNNGRERFICSELVDRSFDIIPTKRASWCPLKECE